MGLKKKWVAGVGVVLSLMLFGCAVDQDKEANRLYVEASQFMHDMKGESESYSTAFEFYKNAKVNVDRVLSECPSSDLAVALLSEGTKIAGVSLTEFRDLEEDLESLAGAEQDILSCAVVLAETMGHEEVDTYYLCPFYVDLGLFDRALSVAQSIEDGFYKTIALEDIAREYAAIGLFEKAFETIDMIDPADRGSVLSIISMRFARNESFSLALETADGIEDNLSQTRALNYIASVYAKLGKKEEATHMLSLAKAKVEMIEPDYARISNLNEILEKHPDLEEKVIKLLAQEFESCSLKISCFAEIAERYVEFGMQEEASKLLDQAFEVTQTIQSESLKVSCFVKLAEASVDVGLSEKATRLLTQAFNLAITIQYKDARALALVEVAEACAIIGETEQRTGLLSQIVEEVDEVGGLSDLVDVADSCAKGGATEAAMRMLSRAFEVLKTGGLPTYEKNKVLEKITELYVDEGRLTSAVEAANMIEDMYYRGKAIGIIACKYAENGELIRAIEINMVAENISSIFQQDAFWHFENGDFDQAVKTAKTIKDEALGIRTLVEISDRCVDEGEADRAKMLLSQAFEITQGLKNGSSKVELLLLIADKHAMAGRDELKFQHLSQAIRSIKGVEGRYSKARYLAGIAKRYASAEKEIDRKDRDVLSEIVQMEYPMDLDKGHLLFK